MDFSRLLPRVAEILEGRLSPFIQATRAALRAQAEGRPFERVDVEEAVEAVLKEMAPAIVEHVVREVDGGRVRNQHVCPTCGGVLAFAQKKPRVWGFLFGPVRVKRAYFHCRVCRKGHAPLEDAWGLQEGAYAMGRRYLTPRAQWQLVVLCAAMAYGKAREQFTRATGVAVSAMTGWRYAQRLGRYLRQEESGAQAVPFRARGQAG